MNHPVFQSLRNALIYFGSWVLIIGIHFSILLFFYHFPTIISAADSLLSNLLFAILGLTPWYVVRYSQNSREGGLTTLLVNHLSSLVVLVFLWFGGVYTILDTLFGNYSLYGHFLKSSVPWRIVSGVFYYILLVMFYYLVLYYYDLQERMRREVKLNDMIRETELDLLKSQINPHFLFNSLNSISSLTVTSPEKAREMTIKLSDFLRYNVSKGKEKFTILEKELDNVRIYLEIEKVRFGNKLIFEFDISAACLKCELPVMILQPLYENAVKHGVYESTEPVAISTICKLEECCLELTITNNFDPRAAARKGAGIGLKNIRERLKLIYRNEKLMETTINGNEFKVTLVIPISKTP